MNKILEKIKAPLKIIQIIGKYEPLFIIFSLPFTLIKSILPLLSVYFPKIFIEQLTTPDISYVQIAKTVGIYASILIVLNLLSSFLKNKMDLHADIFSKKIKNKIGSVSMELDLQEIEGPETQNLIKLASKAAELTSSLSYIQNIISNFITIIGLVYITIRFEFIFIILICITLFVKIVTVYLEFLHNKKMRTLLSDNSRYVEYLFNIAYFNVGTMKEIRVNNLQDWYLQKNNMYRDDMIKLQYRSFKLSAFFNILTEVVLGIQTFVVLYFLTRSFIYDEISLADFTMYFSAVTSLTFCLSKITIEISNYNQQVLNVIDYQKLFNLLKYNKVNDDTEIIFDKNNLEIEFHNVSFMYPNTNKYVLKDINIKISNNEKLVIVGFNGAGKSTFIKLLCKFYRPTQGKITINGIDIWNIPNNQYYDLISAVFQDFANFAFSIKENVSMAEDANDSTVLETIEKVGLLEKIQSLSKKLKTFLTRQFDNDGIELSGGQSQKISIARAIYKNPKILILDEPTANLDPIAESEIYENFFNLAKDKMTIFISHRLTASTIADNIAVFVDGKIVEYGNHNKLMDMQGVYFDMYEKQRKNYK